MSSIEIIGTKELEAFLQNIPKQNSDELDKLLSLMALDTQNNAIEGINKGNRTGKVYKRRTISHRASAAGEYPKTDTGQLTRNIILKKEDKSHYTVGSRRGAPHGFWLEFGTRFMAARPWLKPSFEKTLKKFEGRFK